MKNLSKLMLIFSALIITQVAFAYNSKAVDEPCRTPKFTKFSLPEYHTTDKIEVAPESEFSFIISNKVDPSTLKIIAKKKELKYSVDTNSSFYTIHSKLPVELTGKFVRINVSVTAKLECKGKDGWLVKISEAKATTIETEPEAENKPETVEKASE